MIPSCEPLDTTVPIAKLPPDFSCILVNEFPFMLNPLEMDYGLLDLQKEK